MIRRWLLNLKSGNMYPPKLWGFWDFIQPDGGTNVNSKAVKMYFYICDTKKLKQVMSWENSALHMEFFLQISICGEHSILNREPLTLCLGFLEEKTDIWRTLSAAAPVSLTREPITHSFKDAFKPRWDGWGGRLRSKSIICRFQVRNNQIDN